MVRSRALAISVIAIAAVATVITPSALAEISGPCTASINGQSVENQGTGAFSDAIKVKNDAIVPVTMRTNAGNISHLTIQIEFAGHAWTVRDRPSHGSSWASSVKVKDYAKYGVGLYKVIGSSSGGVSCSGSALVEVEGNPLSTVAGIVGLVAALAGLGGIGAAVAMTMRAGAMSFGRTLGGAIFGIIAGLGLAILAQEYSLMYPTLGAALASVGIGALFGIGLVFIGKLVGSPVGIAD